MTKAQRTKGPRVQPAAVGAGDPGLVSAQTGLKERLAKLFGEWIQNPRAEVFGLLLGAAILYGMMHALGPGHQKVVVFTLYLTRRAPW